MNRKALVTIASGSKHYNLWKRYAEYSWKVYAERFGYDVVCFKDPLDNSERARKRSISWQKCLILSQKQLDNYDQIVWLDSDIIINYHTAPCIVSTMKSDKIGAVNAWEFYTSGIYNMLHERMSNYARIHNLPTYQIGEQYFIDYGLSPISERAVQGGVLVLNKLKHKDILEHIYNNYEDNRPAFWHYEMRPLSYELIKHDLVEWIDMRYNYVVENQKAFSYSHRYPKNIFQRIIRGVKIKYFRSILWTGLVTWEEKLILKSFNEGYFIHFAGNAKEMVFTERMLR